MNERKDVVLCAADGSAALRADGCGCGGREREKAVCGFGVENGVEAALYCPIQGFAGVYDLNTALRRGTMFEALDKPLYGMGKEVDCRGEQRQK